MSEVDNKRKHENLTRENIFGKSIFFVFVLASVLIVVALVYYLYEGGSDDNSILSSTGKVLTVEEFEASEELLDSARDLAYSGRYEEAASIVENIASDESASLYTYDQIAVARRDSLYGYQSTQDTDRAIDAIRELKKNVLDENISPRLRARSLNSLATSNSWYGRDPRILSTIFGGEVFGQYWVEGSPGLSMRDLLEWSYEDVFSTPKAAISLGRWYANELLVDNNLSSEETASYIETAKLYLTQADKLASAEVIRVPDSYLESRRLAGYRYLRAFIMTALTVVGDSEYENMHKAAYNTFFSTVNEQNNVTSKQYIPFAYVSLAKFSQMQNENLEVSEGYLLEAIQFVNSDPNRKSNEFIDFVRNSGGIVDDNFLISAIEDMRELSPTFDSFIESILAKE